MRIGIDIRVLMDTCYSGVPIYTSRLIAEFLAKDKRNDYVLFYNSFFRESPQMPDFKAPNVKVVRTAYPNKIFNYIMQKGLSHPQIDRLLDVDLFFMPHLNFASVSKECPLVITIHDLSFMRYPSFFSARKNLWHRSLGVKALVERADRIIAVSENTKTDIVELCGAPEEKINVVYPGVDHERFARPADPPAQVTLPQKYLLYLGTLEPRKNIEGIVRAFEIYLDRSGRKDLCLLLAGNHGWKNRRIFRAIDSSVYRDRISLLGYVSEDLKPFLYQRAEAFIYPSFYEGFGFPPLEAMSAGTPVITSSVSSLPEVVKKGALLANPYDCGEIAEAIGLAMRPEIRKHLVGQGRKIAEHMGGKGGADLILGIFGNLVSTPVKQRID
jgi:glycosyltransferase involved in cell wall biosynthesis